MEAKFTLTLKLDSGEVQLAFQEKKDINGLGKTTLISLNIEKEIYRPAHIEAVLQIEVNGNISTMDKINYKPLLDKFVNLNDGQKDIAKDYIIFDYVPEYKPSESGTSLYLKLNIYSPEKVLDFQKYNKCYVAKKLGAQIFKGLATDHSKQIKNVDIENLQHIFIKNEGDNSKTEFIQPYLVQFEETALTFLTRSANRCGEFMFYENGVWQLGFKPSAAVEIEKFASLTFSEFNEREDVDYYETNYLLTDEGQNKLSEDKEARTYSGPKDEYLSLLVEGESNFKKMLSKAYDFSDPGFYVYNMCEWMKKNDATEIVASVVTDIAKNSARAALKNKDVEEKWMNDFFSPYLGNQEQCTTIEGKKAVSPFSNFDACKHFQSDFYTNIMKLEEAVRNQTIHINFGTYYQPLLLGDVVKVMGKEYVIVKISSTCKQNTTVDRAGQYTTFEIDAVPAVKDIYYPPKVDGVNAIVEPQIAIVTKNKDPRDLGRVQIRYTWQPETSTPTSPWIRVAQPFASKEAGIKFLPQVGDEVMIDYEQGEMERPFMLGAMASESRKLNIGENKTAFLSHNIANDVFNDGHDGFFNNDFIIKSINGQYIKFLAPANDSHVNFTTSFFPAVGAWLKYIPLKSDIITYSSNTGRELSGGITMGDAYGFFNICMSTEKRNVTISSALGDVEIDALTGITISAPNGNVKIEGKNVEIIAGNNLTMKSGENVEKMKKAYNKNFGRALTGNIVQGAVDEVTTLLKPFDLTLLRTVLDAFLKPIGGTMLIKSHRFMRLEAGKGETMLPHAAYKKDSKTQKNDIAKKVNELKVKDTIASAVNLMGCWDNFYEIESQNLDASKSRYDNCMNEFGMRLLLGSTHSGMNCTIDGKEIKEVGNNLPQKIKKELPSADDIVKMAEDKNAKSEKAHEKLDKLTYPASYEPCGVWSFRKALKEAAVNLFNIAKRNQTNNIDKDRAISTCLTCADLNFIASVGQANDYESDIKDTLSSVFDTIVSEMKKDQDLTVAKRKILYKVLQKLKDKKYISIENESGLVDMITSDHIRNTVKLDESVCDAADTWEDFLDCVKASEVKESLKTKVGKFIINAAFGDLTTGWKENHIYHPEMDGGEILISDTDGFTRNIKGDTISKVAVSPIKQAIAEIKEI